MTIGDFKLTPQNHFLAMEYYGLILNRTFLILLTNSKLVGIKVNGLVSVETGNPSYDILQLHIDDDLHNPHAYIKWKYIKRAQDVDLFSMDFFEIDRANFVIDKHDLVKVEYDKRKKWGMGYYPHDGKVSITQRGHPKREFIILGAQSGQAICDNLRLYGNIAR
jgi:hypothetical protein